MCITAAAAVIITLTLSTLVCHVVRNYRTTAEGRDNKWPTGDPAHVRMPYLITTAVFNDAQAEDREGGGSVPNHSAR